MLSPSWWRPHALIWLLMKSAYPTSQKHGKIGCMPGSCSQILPSHPSCSDRFWPIILLLTHPALANQEAWWWTKYGVTQERLVSLVYLSAFIGKQNTPVPDMTEIRTSSVCRISSMQFCLNLVCRNLCIPFTFSKLIIVHKGPNATKMKLDNLILQNDPVSESSHVGHYAFHLYSN